MHNIASARDDAAGASSCIVLLVCHSHKPNVYLVVQEMQKHPCNMIIKVKKGVALALKCPWNGRNLSLCKTGMWS